MRPLRAGASAVLVEVDSADEAMALYAAAVEANVTAREIVPAARTVLFDGVDEVSLKSFLGSAPRLGQIRLDGRSAVEIPTAYDGPDLDETADLLSMTPDELVDLHTSTSFTVAFCGFSPGFAYCTGLDVDVPRLESPRTRVEPGSVGLAGEFTGVYPSASPGGWRLIGSTEVALWDVARDEPALLSPGTTVRFLRR